MTLDTDTKVQVINNLTSGSTTAALSAAQGKALNDKLSEVSGLSEEIIQESYRDSGRNYTVYYSDLGKYKIIVAESSAESLSVSVKDNNTIYLNVLNAGSTNNPDSEVDFSTKSGSADLYDINIYNRVVPFLIINFSAFGVLSMLGPFMAPIVDSSSSSSSVGSSLAAVSPDCPIDTLYFSNRYNYPSAKLFGYK